MVSVPRLYLLTNLVLMYIVVVVWADFSDNFKCSNFVDFSHNSKA